MSRNKEKVPLVSLGMPVFNGERYLNDAIQSLLAQSFEDFEIVIADNASTDRTRSICERYLRDKRVRYCRFEENRGAAPNYNYAFWISRGKYFKWAAYDDLLEPRYLEKCVAAFEAAPDAAVVYSQATLIDEHGKPLGQDRVSIALDAGPYERLRHFYRVIDLANPIFGLIRADLLERTRLIDSFIGSDLVLLAELLMLGRFCEVEEPLFKRRIHAQSSCIANVEKAALLAWFNTSKRRILDVLPRQMRLSLEFAISATQVPPTLGERAGCLAATVAFQWGRAFVRSIKKRRQRERLRRSAPLLSAAAEGEKGGGARARG